MNKEILNFELTLQNAYIDTHKCDVYGYLLVDCIFKENGITFFKRDTIKKSFNFDDFGIELEIIKDMTFGNKQKLWADEMRRINKPKFRKELNETIYEWMSKNWQNYFSFDNAIPLDAIKKLLK